jgi:hypothetical protein
MKVALCHLVLAAFVLAVTPCAAQSPAPPSAQTRQITYKAEELDQLLAPVALYPDHLLSQVLIASTYPLEVVTADRWVQQNKSLKGDALKKALDKQTWDESVKALAAVPDVLSMMSAKLEWTQKLGDAVLAQQADVMDAIQRLRAKAEASEKLKTTKQQKVTKSSQGGKQIIAIESAQPETIYVPYYDPAVVYGEWPYTDYPPYAFSAPGYIASGVIAAGIAFATGVAVGAWITHGVRWGGSFNWGSNNININNDIDINRNKNWVHNPDHRHGVRYNNDAVRQKFGKADIGDRDKRMDFRGRDGQQVLQPDRDRPTKQDLATKRDRAGQRDPKPGGDRASKAPRPADRKADRPTGERPNVKHGDRNRPAGRPHPGGRDNALSHIDRGGREHLSGNRGRASMGGRPPIVAHPGGRPGGGGFAHGGGRPGGGGVARGGGGRRR